MKNILDELKKDKKKTIALLKSTGKKRETIESILKEFYKNKRDLRDTQVGKIQKDRVVETKAGNKIVKQVQLSIPFQKKIVTNSTAFEVGKPVTLVSNTDNKNAKLPELIKKLWMVNRIDSIIQKLVYLKKAQTEGALMFFIDEVKPDSIYLKLLNRLGFKETKKQIKLKLLDNRKGSMYPYFDDYGDMKAFVWEFKTESENKTTDHIWIFDEKQVHKTTTVSEEIKSEAHGFDRIPIVYVSQEETEWKDAQDLIDRYEVALSKLAGSNDYTAHPMLKVFGEVLNAPDEDGKAWLIPIKRDKDGNEIKGDVQLITNPNSADSTDLELSKVEDAIWSIT